MSSPQKCRSCASDISSRKYLVRLLGTTVFLFVFLVATLYLFEKFSPDTFEKKFPAPRFSASESFNEKIRWIRNSSGYKCDVLIIGSSMALNNINGESIRLLTHGGSVMNISSWGLSVSEAAILLDYIVPICKPKVILYATYYGDFDRDNQDIKKIDWALSKRYLAGESPVISYLRSLDPLYYSSTYFERRSLSAKGRSIYQSLEFDTTGSVMLDCENFEIIPARWNDYNHKILQNSDIVLQNLSALENIEKIAFQHQSKLLVIATPLRSIAEEKLSVPELSNLWDMVQNSVIKSRGDFINIGSAYGFSDDKFVDFAHLNICGASKISEIISPTLSRLLNSGS